MKNAAKAMKAAWTNSRRAAAKFGGKASEYFSICLKDAWAWVKSTSATRAIGTVVRETAKAVMVEWEVTLVDRTATAGVWFPKSQLQEGRAPMWLFKEKQNALRDRFRYICGIEIL